MLNYSADQAMHLKREPIGFHISNKSCNLYIFLHFINPVNITLGGTTVTTSSNACILFSPNTPLNYFSDKIQMLHNFLHFNVDNQEEFSKLNIPVNTIFYTNLQNDITNTIEKVEICSVKKFSDYKQTINHLIAKMFEDISKERGRRINYEGISAKFRFDDLRSLIFQNPKQWSIETMAKHVNLSRSRFSTKYKELFNVTPNDDLTYAAMLYANRLLSTTDLLVSDIAYECGFTSPDYFIRLYKKHYNMTPGSYRKQIKNSKRNLQ